jgi:putative transposase
VAAGLRRSRLVGVLKEHEAGAATAALCRQHGISEQTFYRWKQKYGGLERGEATRLKALEEENGRLKRLVAEQALDNQILKDLLRKNA